MSAGELPTISTAVSQVYYNCTIMDIDQQGNLMNFFSLIDTLLVRDVAISVSTYIFLVLN